MSKTKDLSYINAELKKMLTDGESLKDFYRITALNPHIELHDVCQIFVERPAASVCFSFEEWNAMGRRIHKGSQGIKYFDNDGNKKYVFEETDTHGDSSYKDQKTPIQKVLDGLDLITDKTSTHSTDSHYLKIYNRTAEYMFINDNYLSNDSNRNRLLCEGIAYSVYCKTDSFSKDNDIMLRGLPYALHENAELVKEINFISNRLTQEIENAYLQAEQVKAEKEKAAKEPKNIVVVQSAVISNYKGYIAFAKHLEPHKPYTEEEIYLGKDENYDNHGNYDNSDNSLIFISKNPKMFSFLYGDGWVKSQQEMIDNGAFTNQDYAEFNELQNGILKQFECVKNIKFGIDIDIPDSGTPFLYPTPQEQKVALKIQEPEKPKPTVTPYYQKYLDEQNKHPNDIVLIRLGDFYEAMDDSAIKLSKLLDLTLTGRNVGLPERVPMCGFPHHAFEVYMSKIIESESAYVIEPNGEVWDFRSKQKQAEERAFATKFEESFNDEQDFEEYSDEEQADFAEEFAEELNEVLSNDRQDIEADDENFEHFENEYDEEFEEIKRLEEQESEDNSLDNDGEDFDEEFEGAEEYDNVKQPQEKKKEKDRKSIRERNSKKTKLNQPSLFDFFNEPKEQTPQERLIEHELKSGSGTQDGKFRIYEEYFSDPTVKEFADFLKKEYGWYGHSGGDAPELLSRPNGLTMALRDRQNPENDIVVKMNWTEVANEIADLIDNNNYLTEEERLEYEEYKTKKQAKNPTIEPISNNLPPQAQPTVVQSEKPNLVNTDLSELELDSSELGGAKSRFRSNIEAIRLVDKLFEENRTPTNDEKKTLAKYVGWGGIQQAFDEHNESWQKEYLQLKNLLGVEDYDRARGSVLNAHYTSREVIEGVYKALDRFGVKGNNRILEPAMGTGNFYGYMPKEITENAKLYGVELDNITGRIAQKLYPNVNVQIKGFEQTSFPNNHFDIVVSNVPFGNYSVYDIEYNKHNFHIHDYFIAKGIDKLKPNGIMAVITSKFTMDKLNPAVRKHIADRAELLGAIRLPNTAFKQTANTEVTADILFFQKREQLINSNENWVYTSGYPISMQVDGLPDGYLKQDVKINSYFADNPKMMLGTLTQEHGLYGAIDVTLNPDGRELSDALNDAINHLPKDIYKNPEFSADNEKEEITVDYDLKPLCFKAVGGRIYMRVGEIMEEQPLPSSPQNAYERIAAMIELRSDIRHILDIQSKGCSDEVLSLEQRQLNYKYERFVRNYGIINGQTNTKLFREDGDSALLFASENIDEDTKAVTKADIFSKRTIRPYTVVTHTDDCFEALQISKNEKGKVDIAFIEELTDKGYDTILSELDTVIFRNPLGVIEGDKYSGFETSEEYLSGEVVKKLKIASQFVQHEKKLEFERNVKALTEIQPEPIKASEISARLGASWINKEYYHKFICELLQLPYYCHEGVEIFYNPHDSSWKVSRLDYVGNHSHMNVKQVYGTERAGAYRLFEDCLNLKATQIYDTIEEDGKPKRVLNHNETIAAREKQNKIKEAFKDWIFKDPERREELEIKYNSLFNQIRLPKYDGSYLKFPQMNPAIELNEHQKDAVHRSITGGNTLLHHVVGSGKTYTICATAMKLRQYGLAKKPMIVVPNHLVEQWAGEFRTLYPTANLLIASKEDLEKENRKRFVSKVAMGDWDAVIIAQSSFNKIPISEQRQKDKIVEEICSIEDTIASLWDEGNAPRGAVKNLERIKKNKEAFLKKLMDGDKKDNVLIFESLGIDHLFVDEAHYYKNLFLYTKMNNVAGISMSASQRASDLQLKCEYINELHDADKGIVFATGTPISNSMTEMYVMQTYLQKRTLEKLGMTYFDGWAANFGETTTSLEMSPSGQGYKAKTRFAKFTNLPELLTLYRSFSDVKTADMIKLNVPEAERKVITLKPSDTVLELAQQIAERAERISKGGVDPSIDNMLKITSDGKKLALDPRCFDRLVGDESTSKLNECASRIYEIWEQSQAIRGTQLVFCDLSTPKKAFEDYEYGKDFDVYNDLKYKLVQKGIPQNEIAFIHDANSDLQKQTLFNSVNDGKIRVLIGSTEKCGSGTNVQKRLVALHHLDTPYRPSDLQQRDGRIIRQGNPNEKVQIFTYVTERTFDSYSYQILENKSRFISQIDRGDLTVREAEDIDETTLSYAEIKAITAANPKIKRKMEIDTEVSRLRILKGQFEKSLHGLEDKIRKELPEQIRKQTLFLERTKEDIITIKQNYNPDLFSISVLGTTYTDKKEGGKALMDAFDTNKTDKVVAEFCGFKLSLNPLVMLTEERSITIKGAGEYNLNISASPSGTLTRLDNFFTDFHTREERIKNKIIQLQQDLEIAKEEVTKPFEHQARLAVLIDEQAQINAELDLNKREEIVIDDSGNGEETEADEKQYKEIQQAKTATKTKRKEMSKDLHKIYKDIAIKSPKDAYLFIQNGNRYELVGQQANELAKDYGLTLIEQDLGQEKVAIISLESDQMDKIIAKLVDKGKQIRVIEPQINNRKEENIIENTEKEITLLPDYTVDDRDRRDYGTYSWKNMLPLREQAAERLQSLGLKTFTLYPDDDELRTREDRDFEPRRLYGINKGYWHSFLKTDTAIEYLSARFSMVNVADKTVNEKLNFVEEYHIGNFKNSNNNEKAALIEFLTGKNLDDSNIKKYWPKLLDEFVERINEGDYLDSYGYTDVRKELTKNIDNAELKNYSMQISLLPDYTISKESRQDFAHSVDYLPLRKNSAERLDKLGLDVYMTDGDTIEKLENGVFDNKGLYAIKKTDWYDYLDTDKAVDYMGARLVIANAASQVVDEELSYVDAGFTLGFSNDNFSETEALKDYLSVNFAPKDENMIPYLPDLIDGFTTRINGWHLEHYGWDSNDVRNSIIKNMDNAQLKSFVEFDIDKEIEKMLDGMTAEETDEFLSPFGDGNIIENADKSSNNNLTKDGLMIKSGVAGWPDWTTKTLPDNVRQSAEWLIINGFENESDVKSAFYYRQTSSMSDDRNAEENDNAAIIRVAKKYRQNVAETSNENQNTELKNNKTLVVNLLAGPSAGKTTAAHEITALLKKQGVITEYVPEYAKELVWAGDFETLKNQRKVTSEQYRRLDVLRGKTEVIITDSPVLLGEVYGKNNTAELNTEINAWHNSFDNFNLFIKRGKDYEQAGRVENEEQAKEKDREILDMLKAKKIYYGTYSRDSAEQITKNIITTLRRIQNNSSKEENEKILSQFKEEKQIKPLYNQSFYYADKHGEIELYHSSLNENRECAKAIEKAINENYKEFTLEKGFENTLVEQYGLDRVSYVLANTIQRKDWDGRFSSQNKEWARGFLITEETDTRGSFIVESHPAISDMFIKRIREMAKENETAKTEIKEEKLEESKQQIPVYKQSVTHARENGEIEKWRESLEENNACTREIDETIRANFDGAYLKENIEKPLIEKYGTERMSYVLANTVQYYKFDGRYSHENKEWANGFEIFDTEDRKSSFVLRSHLAVTDLFVTNAREVIKEIETAKKEAETTETAKEKNVWLKVNVARDALIRKYEKSSFMRMPTTNPDYADYTYNIFNNHIKESRQIADIQSDTSELSYELNIAEKQEIRLTNKNKETLTLTGKEFSEIVGGTTSKDYAVKKQNDDKQWFAINMPDEAMIGGYENTSLFQMPQGETTSGFSYYVPNSFISTDEEEAGRIIVRLPEDFEITAKNKDKETLKLSAYQLFSRCNDTEIDEYAERKSDSGNWNYLGICPAAKIAEYEQATLFKMPKGEYENFVYYLPNSLVKENEESETMQFSLPNDLIIKLSNNKSGEKVDLSALQFMNQVKDKLDTDYNSNFQKPSESKTNAFAKNEQEFISAIPDEMKERPNWIIIRTKENAEKGRLDKYLINCKTGKGAEIDNPDTWVDFKTACEYAKKNGGETLAYALDGKDKICCIDLDGSVDEKGNYSALAKDLINKSKGTFVEKSISGKGLHIFGKTDGLDIRTFAKDGDLEFYQKSHFIAMTGNTLDNSKELKNLDNTAIKAVLENKCNRRTELSGAGLGMEGLSSMSDRDVVEKAIKSKNGDTFKALYNGQDLQNNKSNSDMSLMNRLAFWCNGDKEQMLRVFATSGLYRQSKSISYYEHTVIKAIRDTTSRFQPQKENNTQKQQSNNNKPSSSGGNSKA